MLAFLLSATGILETIKITFGDSKMMIADRKTIEFNRLIGHNTEPGSIFLTAASHNHPVLTWAARPILLGFTPWVKNFGFDPSRREADMKIMFQGGDETSRLLCRYDVSYIYCGPDERGGGFKADCTALSQTFPLAFSNSQVKVFDTRSCCE